MDRLLEVACDLAYAMVDDRETALDIAERATARALAPPGRKPERREVMVRRSVVRLVRRHRFMSRTPSSDDPAREALGRLAPARRAALIMGVRGMEIEEIAEVLDRSTGGAQALVDRARQSSGDLLGFHGGDLDSAILRSLPQRADRPGVPGSSIASRSARRRWFTIAAGALAVVALTGWGLLVLSDEAAPVPSTPIQGSFDAHGDVLREARATLAGYGAPGWCPDLTGTLPLGATFEEAADVALRFDISLASGYKRTVDALQGSATDRPPSTDMWPHHETPSGLAVVQMSPGGHDPDLVRSCGRAAAERSVKVVVIDRSEEPLAIGLYAVQVNEGWRVWGSSGPAPADDREDEARG